MLRYRRLILNTLEPPEATNPAGPKPPTLRELAKTLGIPVASLHNYVNFDTLPRLDNINKMVEHYGETISSLFSEDDDQTVRLVEAVRQLSPGEKQTLLVELTRPKK